MSEFPRPSMTWALLLQGVTRGRDGGDVAVVLVGGSGQEKGNVIGSDLTAAVEEGSGVSSTGSGLGAAVDTVVARGCCSGFAGDGVLWWDLCDE